MNPQAALIGYRRNEPPPNFGFPPHRSDSPGINLRDNLSDVFDKWLTDFKDDNWQIDSDHFAKFLPFTTNDLRQEWVAPSQVAESLWATFKARTTRDERTWMIQNIAIRASGKLGSYIDNLQLHGVHMREFDWRFEVAVTNRFGSIPLQAGLALPVDTLRLCLRDALDGFTDYLFFRSDRCQRPTEFFLLEEWLPAALLTCAATIADGEDLRTDRCWQCGNMIRNARIVCWGCHATKYCSHHCRKNAFPIHRRHCELHGSVPA